MPTASEHKPSDGWQGHHTISTIQMSFLLAAKHFKLHDLDMDTMDSPVSNTQVEVWPAQVCMEWIHSKKIEMANGWDVL